MRPRKPTPARATIRDVSRLAGVSIKTVSRVLNNEKYVQGDTRARVEQAIQQLGFQPSFAARALAGRRTHQIALICDNPNPWYMYEVVAGARARCALDGVRVLAQPYDRAAGTLLEDVVRLVDQVHPDGIILTPPGCDDPRVLHELSRRKVPIVRIQPGVSPEETPAVGIDNEAAMYAVTQYLIAHGHRRIGFIVGDRSYPVSEQRLNGYMRALTEAGQRVSMNLLEQGSFEFSSGIRAADRLLKRAKPPTAILASNDEMAAGVLAAAHRRGMDVPGELSVAGFDDAPIAQMTWPSLTTVRQPLRQLAEEAAKLLLSPAAPASLLTLAHELIERDSTGARRLP